ncbi:TlpA disulfide reductase family protein [uncultured Sunxiuqinia sp.]|uniref:TlpA family protein disulfide reductase n=1 Tax=uncultured Sunxiuqinia sp. TaxID=1573825 RepID=UPI002AA6EDA9|nr:TlpA disulfide reductase family protein [uncultured Sunxiuqinia sp.]
MKSTYLFSLAIVSLVTFSSTLFAQQSEEEKATIVQVGQQVPHFVFKNEDGEELSISDLKGQVVMINFFATWCGPCLKELPHVESNIFDTYKDNPNFRLLVIGREHNSDELATFKEKKGYSFQLIADLERKIYSKFAEQFIPRNFIIDREGKIIYSSVGFNEADFNELKKVLASELAN